MIRPARIADAKPIQQLVNYYAERGVMLPLSLNEVYDSLRDFSVYEQGGEIVSVCALHTSWQDLAEIRSLAVQPRFTRQGIGSQILRAKLDEARILGAARVFALTYMPQFFAKHGFVQIDKAALPHKIWTDCVKCVKFPDCCEIAMLKVLD